MTGRLTDQMIGALASAISCQAIERIAIGYLGIDMAFLESQKFAFRSDTEGFTRKVLQHWRNNNSNKGINQIQELKNALQKAAREHGMVDMHKIHPILKEDDSAKGTDEDTGPHLTDKHLDELARQMTDETMLRTLSIMGLDLTMVDVQRELTNYPRDIHTAAFRVLYEWRNTKQSRSEAYKEMCEALRTVNMALLIDEVLKK